jgi:hypothetical protein
MKPMWLDLWRDDYWKDLARRCLGKDGLIDPSLVARFETFREWLSNHGWTSKQLKGE